MQELSWWFSNAWRTFQNLDAEYVALYVARLFDLGSFRVLIKTSELRWSSTNPSRRIATPSLSELSALPRFSETRLLDVLLYLFIFSKHIHVPYCTFCMQHTLASIAVTS